MEQSDLRQSGLDMGDSESNEPIAGDAGYHARPLGLPRDFVLRRLLAAADLIAIAAALTLATRLAYEAPQSGISRLGWGLLTLPAWLLLFKAYGLYDRDNKRVSHSTVDDVPWIFHALVIGSLALWGWYKLVPTSHLVFRQGAAFFAAAFLGIFVARAVARRLAVRMSSPERVVLVGSDAMVDVLVQKMRSHPEYGLDPVGYVEVAPADAPMAFDVPYFGPPEELERICVVHAIDRVVFAGPTMHVEDVTELIRSVRRLDLGISILPQLVDVLGPSVEVDDVEGITVLGVNPPALTPSSRLLKRAMDIVIAALVLLAALPVLVAAAIAIRRSSPGPVFFRQDRIGRGGRRFSIVKLRTMVADADSRAEELRHLSAHPAWLLLDHDPRITRVGRLLRSTSLDELPQLWNVLRGDMSLVGPRPLPVDEDARISGWGRRRLDLTPGITGLWQVLGRTAIPFEEMVKLDYLYVTNWSLWQDVRLLIHTLPAIAGRRGVN
jgi:exopolysaccharide biosynthesis polyprenyl glycosylphosphotransferase